MADDFSVKHITYRKRVFKTLIGILVSIVFYSIIFSFSLNGGKWVIIIVDAMLVLYAILILLPTCKYYLLDISFDEQNVEVVYYEYDKLVKKTYSLEMIKFRLFESFFGVLKFGRNYQIIIEEREGSSYKFNRVLRQFEIGDWTLQKFKNLFNLYNEYKGEKVNLDNIKRQNW